MKNIIGIIIIYLLIDLLVFGYRVQTSLPIPDQGLYLGSLTASIFN